MESASYDPTLLASPHYMRRPGSPGLQPPSQPQAGLSVGMPMMQPPMRNPPPMMAPAQPHQAAAQPPGSPSLSRARKSNRVLQLPPPLRNKTNYNIPLPHDCEGLIYALEGKFDCGLEIVADAAMRILEAVTERYDFILQAGDPAQTNHPFKSLINYTGVKLSSNQKSAKVKLLESSWVTSTFLADVLVSHCLKLADEFEKMANAFEVPELSATLLLEAGKRQLEFETLCTLVEALEKWVQIWLIAGVLERPKLSEAEMAARENYKTHQSLKKKPSVLVVNPAPPQPRGVGRPRLIPVISIGDFVDTIHDGVDLSAMQPFAKPKIYYKVVRCLLKCLTVGRPYYEAAVIEANKLGNVVLDEASGPSFPIDEAKMDVDSEAQIGKVDRLTNEEGRSIFLSEEAWSRLGGDLFVDNELKEMFLETVKEAEFLIWRENRRTASSIEMTTTMSGTGQSNERIVLEDYLEKKDMTVLYPVCSLNNQLICSSLSCLTSMLHLGDAELVGGKSLAKEIVHWIIDLWHQCYADQKLSVLFNSTGLHLLSVILTAGRDYLTVIKPFLLKHEGGNPEFANDFLRVLCDISYNIMLLFGRLVSLKLFPSVPSALSHVLDRIAPKCESKLCVDLQTCKSAVVMTLIGIEELPNDYPNWNSLWYGLLYSAFGTAVALGRINGFVAMHKGDRKRQTTDIKTIEVLLQCPPENIREKTCQLLKQKSPQLASSIPIISVSAPGTDLRNEDDLDTSLQSQDNHFLISKIGGIAPSAKTPIDTYDESVDAPTQQVELLEDILYACTMIFVGLSKENPEFAAFLKRHVRVVEEIGLLSRSPLLCRLVDALERTSDLMRWSSNMESIDKLPAYVLSENQLNS